MAEFALSIKNPWAYGIVLGRKDVENRNWRTTATLPLRVWIHASKAYDRDVPGLPDEQACASRAGTICGRATVTGIHDADECRCDCSPWAQPGQWHWMLDDVLDLDPVPARGSLGLWIVPSHVLAQLRERVPS